MRRTFCRNHRHDPHAIRPLGPLEAGLGGDAGRGLSSECPRGRIARKLVDMSCYDTVIALPMPGVHRSIVARRFLRRVYVCGSAEVVDRDSHPRQRTSTTHVVGQKTLSSSTTETPWTSAAWSSARDPMGWCQ